MCSWVREFTCTSDHKSYAGGILVTGITTNARCQWPFCLGVRHIANILSLYNLNCFKKIQPWRSLDSQTGQSAIEEEEEKEE
jgi:hypothetical protein